MQAVGQASADNHTVAVTVAARAAGSYLVVMVTIAYTDVQWILKAAAAVIQAPDAARMRKGFAAEVAVVAVTMTPAAEQIHTGLGAAMIQEERTERTHLSSSRS